MPLAPSSRSSGTRVQEISRQFTEPERAIDNRITNHLTSPMPQATGFDAATNYKWLEDDLRFRGAITAQLNQERDLANAQSVRQVMDAEFANTAEDEAETINAFKAVNEMRASNPNMPVMDALAEVTKGREDLWLKPAFLKHVDSFAKVQQTDLERQSKQYAQEATVNTNAMLAASSAERRQWSESPEGLAQIKVVNQATREAEARGARRSPQQQELLDMELDYNYKTAKDQASQLELYGPPGSREARAVAANMFTKAGLTLDDPGTVADYLRAQSNKTLLEMSLNSDFVKTLGPDAMKTFATSIGIEANPSSAKPEEVQKAKAFVDTTLGAYIEYSGQSKQRLELQAKLEKIGEDTGKSVSDMRKFFDEIKGEKVDKEKPTLIAPDERAIEGADSFLNGFTQKYPKAKPLIDKYRASLKEAWKIGADIKKPDEKQMNLITRKRVSAAESIVDDFANEFSSIVQSPGATSSAPATATTPPIENDFSKLPKDEAIDRISKLPSGTTFIAPDGKPYRKP